MIFPWLEFKDILLTMYTALQKFGNALEKWGFGQYWHESFLICDNFALIRDNKLRKHILLHKQFIHRKK